MSIFKMNGQPIMNTKDYDRCFNPYDILASKNDYLNFVEGNFRCLSSLYKYCYSMVFVAVNKKKPIFMCNDVKNIEEQSIDYALLKKESFSFWDNPFGFYLTEELNLTDECLVVDKIITNLLNGSKISSTKLIDINIMLISAYIFFSGRKENIYIEPLKAAQFYSDGLTTAVQKNDSIIFGSNESECGIPVIFLNPRKESYSLPVNGNYIMKDNTDIRTYKIQATQHMDSLTCDKVLLAVDDRQISIPFGQHIYVNVVEGNVVSVLQTEDIKSDFYAKNIGKEKDCIKISSCKGIETLSSDYGTISSFAISDNGKVLLYIEDNRLKRKCFDKEYSFELLEINNNEKIVEVKIVRNKYYLLTDHGKVISNDASLGDKENIASLDYLIRGVGYESI